jgi:hypothetical protein
MRTQGVYFICFFWLSLIASNHAQEYEELNYVLEKWTICYLNLPGFDDSNKYECKPHTDANGIKTQVPLVKVYEGSKMMYLLDSVIQSYPVSVVKDGNLIKITEYGNSVALRSERQTDTSQYTYEVMPTSIKSNDGHHSINTMHYLLMSGWIVKDTLHNDDTHKFHVHKFKDKAEMATEYRGYDLFGHEKTLDYLRIEEGTADFSAENPFSPDQVRFLRYGFSSTPAFYITIRDYCIITKIVK